MGFFSRKTTEQEQKEATIPGLTEQQEAIYATTFALAAKLAKADGKISRTEAEVVKDLIDNKLQLDATHKQLAIQVFNKAQASDFSFEQIATEFARINKGNQRMLEWMLELLVSIAHADDEFSQNERTLVEKARSIFGISEATYRDILSRYATQADSDFNALGCLPDASIEDITKQYKKLCTEYDSERLKAIGVPQDFIAMAADKRAKIEVAYQNVLKKKMS